MKYVETMTTEKIKKDTYMIWVESGFGFGPCSLYSGSWFWSKDFGNIKRFIKEKCVLYGLLSLINVDEEDYDMSFEELINKYSVDLDLTKNSIKDSIKIITTLINKDEKNIAELNINLYELIKEFRNINGKINIYVFDSPYSARVLVESHKNIQLDDFDEKFEVYFNEDIL